MANQDTVELEKLIEDAGRGNAMSQRALHLKLAAALMNAARLGDIPKAVIDELVNQHLALARGVPADEATRTKAPDNRRPETWRNDTITAAVAYQIDAHPEKTKTSIHDEVASGFLVGKKAHEGEGLKPMSGRTVKRIYMEAKNPK